MNQDDRESTMQPAEQPVSQEAAQLAPQAITQPALQAAASIESGPSPKKRGLAPHVVRGVCIGAVFALGVVSAIANVGVGTLSSMGIGYIAYICPLGALEAMLGQWAFVPRAAIGLAAVLILALLVGRSFCAWACPVPPLRKFFSTKKMQAENAQEMRVASQEALDHYRQGTEPERKVDSKTGRARKLDLDSRHIVLCGALGSAAIFGFPVFCLVCPIGLSFALVIGLVRLVGFNEPSFSLILFAAILIFELVFLRKWCAKICPVGALLSLVAKANKTFRPHVDKGKCLRAIQGQDCGVCAAVCPERIDPQADRGPASISECTRCARCSEACPAAAISFPLLAQPEQDDDGKMVA